MAQPSDKAPEVIVYIVRCWQSDKSYIGMTQCSLKRRWNTHLRDAAKRRFNMPLHKAIRRYGEDAFRLAIIYRAGTRHEAAEAERRLIVEFGTYAPLGYNLAPGGDGGPTRTGHINSPRHRERIGAGQRGRKLSNEQIRQMSKSRRGIPLKPEHATKVRLGGRNNKGKKRTETDRLAGQVRRRMEAIRRAKGVYFDRGRWVPHIMIDGKRRKLGRFLTEADAKAVYDRAAQEHLARLTSQNWSG